MNLAELLTLKTKEQAVIIILMVLLYGLQEEALKKESLMAKLMNLGIMP